MGHSNMMPLIRHLLASQKWTVVHYDSVAVVMVRKAGPNGHLSAMPLPAPIQNEAERWAYLNAIEIRPSVIDSFSRWLLGAEEVPFEKDRLGTFLLTAGQWKEAERPQPGSVASQHRQLEGGTTPETIKDERSFRRAARD